MSFSQTRGGWERETEPPPSIKMISEWIRYTAEIFGKTRWSSENPFKVFCVLKWSRRSELVFLPHVIISLLICRQGMVSHEIYLPAHNLSQLQSWTEIIARRPPGGKWYVAVYPCVCVSLGIWVCSPTSSILLCENENSIKRKHHFFFTDECHE